VVESIQHQLIDCPNARRLWAIFHQATGSAIPTLADIIVPGDSLTCEIIKSVIVRKLLQVDRSRTTLDGEVKQELIYFLKVEAAVNHALANSCMGLIQRISP